MKKIKCYAIIVGFILCACGNENTTQTTTNEVVEIKSNSPKEVPVATETLSSVQENTDDKPKTDAELVLEAFTVAVDITEGVVDDKRRSDSIRRANKEKLWAYQIGFEKTDKDDVFEVYDKLIDLNVDGLYVFRKARKDYIIVKYEARAKDDLVNELADFKSKIAGVDSKVEVINLMDFCSLKEVVRKDGEISKRKKTPIPCLTCMKE